ncbi:MAG: hypothetical protein HKL85_05450 [Acidimicrobiaceae bacterium]|nr:hypothetical protein [Acidimicrobiaceae bacterium]
MSDSPTPHRSRLSPSRADFAIIMAAHDVAVEAGHKTYLDPATGLIVQTRNTHLERGTCCANGCRHCPWVERY